jgi:filamentous hemagglutinin
MSNKARRTAEMRAATRQLREDIKNGKVDGSMFTEKQTREINRGSDRIPGFTWHHNAQSSPNNMQLIPRDIHKIPHTGEGSMSNGK